MIPLNAVKVFFVAMAITHYLDVSVNPIKVLQLSLTCSETLVYYVLCPNDRRIVFAFSCGILRVYFVDSCYKYMWSH